MTTPAQCTLNYELLTEIVDLDKGHHLEVNAVEVTCLRDVSRGIAIGDILPFVAVTQFLLTRDNTLSRKIPNCEHKTVLMYIDERGAVKSDIAGVDLDATSVARWIAEHFRFDFKARGSERSQFVQCERAAVIDEHTTYLPWIQEINTSSLRGASLDVDFTVTAKAPPVTGTKSQALLKVVKDGLELRFDDACVLLQLRVFGNYASAEDLELNRYWLTLHSDTKPDLRVAVDIVDVEPRYAAPAPASGTGKANADKKALGASRSD